jgi:hypothetical protein
MDQATIFDELQGISKNIRLWYESAFMARMAIPRPAKRRLIPPRLAGPPDGEHSRGAGAAFHERYVYEFP